MSIDAHHSFPSVVILKGNEEEVQWHENLFSLLKALDVELHTYIIEATQLFHETPHGLELDPRGGRILQGSPILWKSSTLLKDPQLNRQLISLLKSEMGIFATIEKIRSYEPFLPTSFPQLDLVLIYDGADYPYAYQEYFSSQDVFKSVQTYQRSHIEKILRFSYDYGRHFHRKKMGCITQKNQNHLSDTYFHHLFTLIGSSFPEIENKEMVFEEALSHLFSHPETFDTLIMPRTYGLLVHAAMSQIIGTKCLSSIIEKGDEHSIFTYQASTFNGSEIIANPTSHWLLSLIQILHFIGEHSAAMTLENGWLTTLEEGIFPEEFYDKNLSSQKYTGKAFVDEVIKRLGKRPFHLAPAHSIIPSKPLTHSHFPNENIGDLGDWQGTLFTIRCGKQKESFLIRLFALNFDGILIEKILSEGKLIYPSEHAFPIGPDLYEVYFSKIHGNGPWQDSDVFELWKLLTSESWDIVDFSKIYTYSYETSLERREFKAL